MKQIWERVRAWAEPPHKPQETQAGNQEETFPEREAQRRGRLLATLSASSIWLTLLLLPGALLPTWNPLYLGAVLLSLSLQIGCMFPNRTGRISLATTLFLLSIVAPVGLILGCNVNSPSLFSPLLCLPLTLAVFYAGALQGARACLPWALVCMGMIIGDIASHRAQVAFLLAGNNLAGDSVSALIFTLVPTVIFVLLTLTVSLTMANMEEAMHRANNAEATRQLYEEAQQQRNRAEYLRHLTTLLTSELDRDELLARLAKEVCDLGYAGCTLLLPVADSEGTSTLERHTWHFRPEYTDLQSELLALHPGHMRDEDVERLLRGEIVAIRLPFMEAGSAWEAMALPICHGWRVLGAVQVWADRRPENRAHTSHTKANPRPVFSPPFNPEWIDFLAAVAEHAAIALWNAEIYQDARTTHARLAARHEETSRQAEELTALNEQLIATQAELEAQFRVQEEINRRLNALATVDGMTELANHRHFQEEISRQMARSERSCGALSLLLLDVDYFKQYNDNFGHPAGDEVLRGVGHILRSVVREGDFPARYGGEEFAILLPETDAETAVRVAERIRAAVEAHEFPNRAITVSVGVASRGPHDTPAVLIQRADVALYEAKSAGRNRVVYIPTELPLDLAEVDLAEVNLAAEAIPGEHGDPSETFEEMENDTGLSLLKSSFQQKRDASDIPRNTLPIALTGDLEGLLQEPAAQVLAALLDALDLRGAETWNHSQRVTRYALRLGQEVATYLEEHRTTRPLLPRLTPGDLADLAFGALLHDIGKTGVPVAVLRNAGKLTDEEWRQIRRHPLVGAELLADVPLLSRALPVVRYHHERWDGTGYPQGLAGEAIPLAARIFAVCDTLDVLTTDGAYRNRMDYAAVRAEIEQGAGTQFDPDVVAAFLRIAPEEWETLGTHFEGKRLLRAA